MSIVSPRDGLDPLPETPVAGHTSSQKNILQGQSSFFKRVVICVGAVVLGGAFILHKFQEFKKNSAEAANLVEAADVELESINGIWEKIQDPNVNILERRTSFHDLTRDLFKFQFLRAISRDPGNHFADIKLPDHNTISDEELLAGTGIPLEGFRSVRAAIHMNPDPSEPSTTPTPFLE